MNTFRRTLPLLTATAAMAGTLLAPGIAAASATRVCTDRSILFVSGRSASSDVLSFGQTLPAGTYDAMLVTADSYPSRATTDASGQQTEIVEVAGIVSHDLADGVESTNDITYGRYTAPAPFSSVTAFHRASTPGPNSVWVSTFCLTPVTVAPTTTTPATTAAPTTAAPTTTTLPTTAAPTTAAPTTAAPTTAAPTTTTLPTTAAPTTLAPTTPGSSTVVPTTQASTTSTSSGSTLGPTTTVAPSPSSVPTTADAANPFGFGEPIPAGPSVPDVMQPMGTATTPTAGPDTLPFTGMGLGVAMLAVALVAVGGVITVGAAKSDTASDAQ